MCNSIQNATKTNTETCYGHRQKPNHPFCFLGTRGEVFQRGTPPPQESFDFLLSSNHNTTTPFPTHQFPNQQTNNQQHTMGGDGGVVATNRRYMRGAGTADHTGDITRYSTSEQAHAERLGKEENLHTCALTGQTLNWTSWGEIVACPFGNLYSRLAALTALLNRGQEEEEGRKLGRYIRGRRDLVPVRFATQKRIVEGEEHVKIVCPITGMELNGTQPIFVLVKEESTKKKSKTHKEKKEQEDLEEEQPNVVSEKAMKEMGMEALQQEYGPFHPDHIIRLIPPSGKVLQEIQDKWYARVAAEDAIKQQKKKKKRKKDKTNNGIESRSQLVDATGEKKRKIMTTTTSANKGQAKSVTEVRNQVAAAVASSNVLTDLFSTGKSTSQQTEAERKANLFAR